MPTYVQKANSTGAIQLTAACTFSTAVAVGDVVIVEFVNQSTVLAVPVDNATGGTNVWKLVGSSNFLDQPYTAGGAATGQYKTYVYTCKVQYAFTTVTPTASGSSSVLTAIAYEYSNCDPMPRSVGQIGAISPASFTAPVAASISYEAGDAILVNHAYYASAAVGVTASGYTTDLDSGFSTTRFAALRMTSNPTSNGVVGPSLSVPGATNAYGQVVVVLQPPLDPTAPYISLTKGQSQTAASATVPFALAGDARLPAAGDLIIWNHILGQTAGTMTTPTGYTLINYSSTTGHTGGTRSNWTFAKISDGTETSLSWVDSASNENQDQILVVKNHGLSSISDLVVGGPWKRDGTTTNEYLLKTTSVTTPNNNSLLLAIGFEATTAAETGSFIYGPTIPSGWAQNAFGIQTAGEIETIMAMSKIQSTAGASSVDTVTYQQLQVNNAEMLTLAIKAKSAANPTAAFTASSSGATLSVDGTTSSAVSGATVTGYDWNWGDSTTHGSGSTATHAYSASGTYTVTLTVTDSNSNTNSVSHSETITVPHTAPSASFTEVSTQLSVVFTDTSTMHDGATESTYVWDFGDGSLTSTTHNPTHQYRSAGTYSVKLTVTDSLGSSSNVTNSISIVGVLMKYWDGTAWHTTIPHGLSTAGLDVIIAKAKLSLNQGMSWSEMKAAGQVFGNHRGGSANYTEMSKEAYVASANNWPSHFLEFSINGAAVEVSGSQPTYDTRHWVGQHDQYFDRMVLKSSGGTTMPVVNYTWAQIQLMQQYAWQTDNPNVPSQPILEAEQMVDIFAGKRVIFIETKGNISATKLLDFMDAHGGPDWFVWKQDGASGRGTGDARIIPGNTTTGINHYDSWGYFFAGTGGSGTTGDMTNYTTYQSAFTHVGLDFNLTDAAYATAYGQTTDPTDRMINHIIATTTQRDRMLAPGIKGLMVSNPRVVTPRTFF